MVSNKKRDFWLLAAITNWFRRPWGARGFNFSVVSAAGCQKVRTLRRNGEQTVNPPARGWPRRGFSCFVVGRRRNSHVSSSCAGGFTFFALGRRRVHISSSGPEGFTFFALGCGRVRVSHPRAPKGSHFPSLGAEGFTFLVLVRRRVHTSRPRVSKGSHFPHAGGPGARGFDFPPRRPQKNLVLKKCVFLT